MASQAHFSKRRKINSRTLIHFFTKALRIVLRGVWLREEPLTLCVIRNSLGNQLRDYFFFALFVFQHLYS